MIAGRHSTPLTKVWRKSMKTRKVTNRLRVYVFAKFVGGLFYIVLQRNLKWYKKYESPISESTMKMIKISEAKMNCEYI